MTAAAKPANQPARIPGVDKSGVGVAGVRMSATPTPGPITKGCSCTPLSMLPYSVLLPCDLSWRGLTGLASTLITRSRSTNGVIGCVGVWSDPPFVTAVELASPSLTCRVQDVLTGRVVCVRDVRGTVESVLRYLLRAQSRATPFGLFAGIAPAEFGAKAILHTGYSEKAAARVDPGWLADMVTALHQRPPVRDHLRVVLANTAFVRDGRLVVGVRRQLHATDEPAEVSVRLTPVVELIASSARRPIGISDLIATVLCDVPSLPASALTAVIDLLIHQHVLITNLSPPSTCTDPVGHVLTTVANTRAMSDPASAAIVRELRPVRDRCQTTLDQGCPSLSVDLCANVRVTLPDAVAREAATAAAVLTRLTAYPHGKPVWVDYHHRFLERYGPGAAIPLPQLINPDAGLGFPAGYRGALLDEPASPPTKRDAGLLRLAQQAALEQRTELVLDAALLDELAADTPVRGPSHLELTARIQSPSLVALNSGYFTLAVVGVFRAAGTTAGRFLDLLTETDRQRMIDAYTTLPTHHAHAVRVQLSCSPLYRDTENVARHPRVLPHLLAIDEHHPADEDLLAVDDLLVIGDTDGFAVWSRTRDQPVEPHLFSAVSLTTRAHPLLRFLCEITTARTAVPGPFSWGVAEHLPFLPGVRHHHTLLAPPRWTLTTRDVSDADWDTALDRWRDTRMVPDTVCLGDGDQRLTLDLTEPAHRHLLRRHLRRHHRATLSAAPLADAFGWLEGRAHEVTVPLATTQPPLRARVLGTADHPDTLPAHLPGASPWLTCVLVSHPDRHTDLLATHLPDLLDDLPAPRPSWWYVPYRDPDHHLRLRLHVPDADNRGVVMTRIGDWAQQLRRLGLISMLRFDTYWPELGRYGGPTAITSAETVFAADSAAALAQRVQTPARDLAAITAASLLDLAIGLAGEATTGCQWLHGHRRPAHDPRPDRALYTAALTLADPRTGRAALATRPGGEQILTRWEQRRTALAQYGTHLVAEQILAPQQVLPSLLHLHCVRTLGIGAEDESRCLHLARAAARAYLARSPRS